VSVTVGYDDADHRTSATLPNNVSVSATYDDASQLTGLVYSRDGQDIGTLFYTYDANGNRASVAGTLASTLLPSALPSATYDAGNRIVARGSRAFTYDANGNVTSDGIRTYTWNARNQLIGISNGATFTYDAEGRRTTKTINGITTTHVFDGPNLIEERQNDMTTATMLFGGIDEVLARTDASGTLTFLSDPHGHTLALADATNVVTRYTYDPFGASAATGAASTNPTQYAGRESDGDLYYYRARYYDPSLERFLSEDPAGMSDGPNLYGYVGNNPINWTDPFGLERKNRRLQDCVRDLSNGGSVKGGLNLNPTNPVLKFVTDASLGNTVGEAIEVGQVIGEGHVGPSLTAAGGMFKEDLVEAAADHPVEAMPNTVTTTIRFSAVLVDTPGGTLLRASLTRTSTSQPTLLKAALGRALGLAGNVLTGKALLDFLIGGLAYQMCTQDGY
jgi:RHS repeat-associated protein